MDKIYQINSFLFEIDIPQNDHIKEVKSIDQVVIFTCSGKKSVWIISTFTQDKNT